MKPYRRFGIALMIVIVASMVTGCACLDGKAKASSAESFR